MDPSEAAAANIDRPMVAGLPPEVAALGERISHTLQRDGGEDPLAVWIGMRIAELMHDAKHAPDAGTRASAARDCQDLVLEAWERRRSWPRGWPPESVGEFAAALERMASPLPVLPQREAPAPGWLGQLAHMLTSLDRERRLWMLLALRELDPAQLDLWLAEGTPMDDDEQESLRQLSLRVRDADEALQRLLPTRQRGSTMPAPRSRDETTDAAVRELRRLLKQRIEALKGAGSRQGPRAASKSEMY